jgi:hypothetical protein
VLHGLQRCHVLLPIAAREPGGLLAAMEKITQDAVALGPPIVAGQLVMSA